MNENEIRNKLYERMQKEYNDFINNLKEASPKEIIDSSYQITMKEELVSMFYPECNDFSIEEIKTLNKTKKPLEELYQGWMDCEYGINSVLKDSAYDTIEFIQKEQKQKNKSQER